MNRFTHQLDAIYIDPFDGYVRYSELDRVLGDANKITDGWPDIFEPNANFSEGWDNTGKQTAVCLIANMSDQDLLECFGV